MKSKQNLGLDKIAALGASTYTFAEASLAQDLLFWITSHIHAFQFFGGISQILVIDNLKAGVTHPHRYKPDINPTYQDLQKSHLLLPGRTKALHRPKNQP